MGTRTGRRLIVLLGWGCATLVAATLAWIAVTGLMARSQLNSIDRELPALRQALVAGNIAAAQGLARTVRAHADRARELTSGPAWWAGAAIPVLGEPLKTGRAVPTESSHLRRDVLPQLVDLAQTLTSSVRWHGSQLSLAPLTSAEPILADAAVAAGNARAAVTQSSRTTWLPMVDSARSAMLRQLAAISDELANADTALRTALPMLGRSAPQRYFIGFENEAEARGIGGIPGAFAIVTIDRGKVTLSHFGTDTELAGVQPNLELGADFTARYGVNDPTATFPNSDISPDFTDAARIWAATWTKKSGQPVTAAVAIDPTALSYLLKVTGPATLPDKSTVGWWNIVALTQREQYTKYSNRAVRKDYLATIAQAVAHRLTAGGPALGLLKAASKSAAGRRLLVWSADDQLERTLTAAGLAGTLDGGPTPFTGFAVVNAAGNKLDYYLDRSMSYHSVGCAAGRRTIATFTLVNRAPATGLPAYVTVREDHPPLGIKPGDNRLLVTYYGTAGARLVSVQLDGKPVTLASGTEKGLLTVTADVELPVGQSRTLAVTLIEPAAHGPVRVLRQPLVRPLHSEISADTCP